MTILAGKRSIMTLYAGAIDPYSHQVRIVLAEKGVSVDIVYAEDHDHLQELADINPYNTVPTLIDRDLVLYESHIIMEYLDERFPHPPLLPVYPVARANSRLWMYRIERDWYSLTHKIETGNAKESAAARKDLQDSINSVAPIFNEKPYFLSDEFSMVDCYMAPLLWRLPQWEIKIAPKAKALKNYAERLFARESFATSLSETEREFGLDITV